MIAPLWLDYRRPPPGRHRLGWWVLALALLAAALLLADYQAVGSRFDETEAGLAQARTRAAARTAPVAAEEGAIATAEWEAMFAALEAAGDDTVTLLSLRRAPGQLQLSGEARDHDAAVDYAARLNASAAFAGVDLTQTEVVHDHPYEPVRFSVLAHWGEAAP